MSTPRDPVVTALPSHEGATVPPTEPRVEQKRWFKGNSDKGLTEPWESVATPKGWRIVRLVELREGERIIGPDEAVPVRIVEADTADTIAALRRARRGDDWLPGRL